MLNLSGPALAIGADCAQPPSMALHELATNAGKYGALSVANGLRCITWRIEGGQVHLYWQERGGPPLPGAPPHRASGPG